MSPHPPQRELLLATQRGDLRARSQLIDHWLPIVLRWCERTGGPDVDAEDAAHDVMVRVITKIGGLRDLDAFPAWTYGIVRRVLSWHRRRAWWKRWVPGFDRDDPDPSPGPELVAEARSTAREVRKILGDLPEELREVLVLCELENLPDDTVATMIGIPSGTVKSRLRRARRAFAEAAGPLARAAGEAS